MKRTALTIAAALLATPVLAETHVFVSPGCRSTLLFDGSGKVQFTWTDDLHRAMDIDCYYTGWVKRGTDTYIYQCVDYTFTELLWLDPKRLTWGGVIMNEKPLNQDSCEPDQ